MESSSLLPIATLLFGGGGIGTILGVVVSRQQNKMVNNAALIQHAMSGLKDLADERARDLERCRARVADLEAQLRRRAK